MPGVPLGGALLGTGLHFIYGHIPIAQTVCPMKEELTCEEGPAKMEA